MNILVFTTFPHSVVFDTELCTYGLHVCMYVRTYICMMYVRTHVCMYVCTYACMYVCMYVYVSVCIYVSMHVRTYVYLCMYCVCVYVRVYIFMQAIPLCYLLNKLHLLLRTQHKFILIAP
jgi:hypothetical protein